MPPVRWSTGSPASGCLATACAALSIAFASPAAGGDPVRSLLEIRHERVVVQEWDLSCGAAALATILNYQMDDPVSEREVALGLMRRAEYVADPTLVRQRWGFSLLDLKRYVVQRGYSGIGYGQLTFDDLAELAPAIVPVAFTGYNHFVVFRGRWRDRVALADPAWGNRTLTVEEFEDAWLPHGRRGPRPPRPERPAASSPAG